MFAAISQYRLFYERGVVMEGIREYLLSVICAAMICAVVHVLAGKKNAQFAIIRLISGLYMSLTLISPLVNIQLTDYREYFNSFSTDAEKAVSFGETAATDELRSIIKSQTEAYILDKAVSMDTVLNVEVTLNNENPPIPCGVTLTGSVSPYSKDVLSRLIVNDLGIAKEDQVWIWQTSE